MVNERHDKTENIIETIEHIFIEEQQKNEHNLFKLTWQNLNVSAKLHPSILSRIKNRKFMNHKTILHDVSGSAYSMSMLAIMGESGSGKTSLLNVLSGFKSQSLNIKGDILLNGKPFHPKHFVTYVEQSDIFISELTVKEHLTFYARMIYGKDATVKKINQVVKDVLINFGLEKCKNIRIGSPQTKKGISGGECRRLSIASQVMSNPKIIFLDEPTSGLDSYTAESVINVLRKHSQTNCIIISTIHQPSSRLYQMFDRLILLSDGKTIFSGPKNDCLNFFEKAGFLCPNNFNPSDFFIETLAKKPLHEAEYEHNIKKLLDTKEIYDDENAEANASMDNETLNNTLTITKRKKTSFFYQFNALLIRSWKGTIRDPVLIKARIFQIIFIGILFGLIFLQLNTNISNVMNFQGAIFSIITNLSFGGAFGVIFVLPIEFAIFRREHMKRLYDIGPYFLSKTVVDLPVFIFMPVLLICVVYYMIGFNNSLNSFLIFLLTSILVSLCSISYGYLIASVSNNLGFVTAIASPLLIPMMLFGGLYIKQADIPVYFAWISYISWFRYSYDALSVAEYSNIQLECDSISAICPPFNKTVSGDVVLKYIGLPNNGLLTNSLILICLMIGYRIIAFLMLWGRTKYAER